MHSQVGAIPVINAYSSFCPIHSEHYFINYTAFPWLSVSFQQGKLSTGQFFPPAAERMAVITADPYKEAEGSDLDKAPQQLAGFEETPVHASDTMYSELFLFLLPKTSLLKTLPLMWIYMF